MVHNVRVLQSWRHKPHNAWPSITSIIILNNYTDNNYINLLFIYESAIFTTQFTILFWTKSRNRWLINGLAMLSIKLFVNYFAYIAYFVHIDIGVIDSRSVFRDYFIIIHYLINKKKNSKKIHTKNKSIFLTSLLSFLSYTLNCNVNLQFLSRSLSLVLIFHV